jgi:succinate-acetate transporter protein
MATGIDFVCCQGSCQAKAKNMDEILRAANAAPSGIGIIFLILGVFLILTAVMLGSKSEPITSILGVVGIGLFFGGAIRVFRRKKP